MTKTSTELSNSISKSFGSAITERTRLESPFSPLMWPSESGKFLSCRSTDFSFCTWSLSSWVDFEDISGFKGKLTALQHQQDFPGGKREIGQWSGTAPPFALDEAFLHLLRLAPTPIICCRANGRTLFCVLVFEVLLNFHLKHCVLL